MRVTVTFCDPALTLASIRVEPSRLARLFFRTVELHDLVVARPCPEGGLLWLYDSTGRRVLDHRVIVAIERTRAREFAHQRLAIERSAATEVPR